MTSPWHEVSPRCWQAQAEELGVEYRLEAGAWGMRRGTAWSLVWDCPSCEHRVNLSARGLIPNRVATAASAKAGAGRVLVAAWTWRSGFGKRNAPAWLMPRRGPGPQPPTLRKEERV
jgi:hypothetical protein